MANPIRKAAIILTKEAVRSAKNNEPRDLVARITALADIATDLANEVDRRNEQKRRA